MSLITPWVVEAMAHFYRVDEVLIAATKEARQLTWPNLVKYLNGKLRYTIVDIPDGKNDAETWQMFDCITNAVPHNAQIVIDVTNGFRTVPMLALAMAIYLRSVKDVQIKDVVYGMFEAMPKKDASDQKQDVIAPIISIRPFIDLIDWTVAIQNFERDGNAESLSGILHDMQDRAHRDQHMAEHPDLPQNLKNAADAMQRVSQALHLLRPLQSAHEAGRAIAELEESSQDIETFAKPFAPLIEKTQAELRAIASGLESVESGTQVLSTQLRMIEWYLSKRKYMQAISLAREWIVAHFAFRAGLDCSLRKEKKEAEARVNNVIYNNRDSRFDYQADLKLLDENLRQLMPQIQKCRNDIDHANDLHPAVELQEKIERLCNQLIAVGEKMLKG